MRWLLDTNVISEPARPSPDPTVLAWMTAQQPLDFALSVLSLGEIAKGVALLGQGVRRTTLEQWLRADLPRQFAGRLLTVDASVAHSWGQLSAEGRRAGRDVPVVDGLLLATAAIHQLTLVTRNEADCAGRGVPVYNPWTGVTHV